ncbi:hypothetical protein HHI36_021959 [Cryptolaemus montrouzieri]|uniref:Fatty acyl-CoA reductase n=1 Tax=Cryptolaemus montrouzieri TaxID=559131 RepID=A0ABD2MZP4_9CUCU
MSIVGIHPVRKGGDIYSSDMVNIGVTNKIVDIFEDATIFITGGTGYLGKIFLEKLLRTCPKLKKIYILLRSKKGKEVNERFTEIFEGPNMVPLKLANPKFLKKVAIINGDCSLPDLGIEDEDKQRIIEEVNFVIHCAATVRFDETLKVAAHINVRGARDLLKIAGQIKNLRGFLHVSTAYSNCNRETIDETFYKPGISYNHLLKLVEMLDDEILEKITPTLIGNWPNTYVFTKCVCEDMIKHEAQNLPIAVLRPSIVIGSVNEPVAGWIDNFYGATGVYLGVALGVLRSLRAHGKNVAEMIPADYVINAGLAALWETVCNKDVNHNVGSNGTEVGDDNENEEIPIYNVVSSAESPITWDRFGKLGLHYAPQIPSEHQVWHFCFALRPNKIHHLLAVFFLHTVPAYLIDFICYCMGKKPMMVKGYRKIHKFMNVISYFAMREWKFHNKNVQKLWQKMSLEDQRLFQFSMNNFDWDNYFRYYTKGLRVYLLKDPLDTVPKGRIKYWKLFFAHYTVLAVLLFLCYKLLMSICSFIF